MLSVNDSVKVKNVCHVLKVFDEVTKIVSGSNYPTANLYLPEIWRIRDVLVKNLRMQCLCKNNGRKNVFEI
jgi:hypothetical protein